MKNLETTTKLKDHQVKAVAKLLPSRLNAIFMDMGTGKSRVIIELAKLRQHKISKVVWFCPVSLKLTVLGELLKHTNLTRDDVQIQGYKPLKDGASFYIVGIETMSQSPRGFFEVNRLIDDKTMVVLDESTYCKNKLAKRTDRIIYLSKIARYRAILTGTPINNDVSDLFAQFYFLSSKILGYDSFYSFAANHLEYSDKYPDRVVRAHNTEYLATKIKPYVYQVTKEECLDLKDKIYRTHYCELTDEQSYYYHETKKHFLDILERYEESANFPSTLIFEMFLRLQQVLSGWAYTGRKYTRIPNNRIQALLDSIQRDHDSDKIVIWAKYKMDIDNVYKALAKEYDEEQIVLYYGDLSPKQRHENEMKFKNKARFFVATPSTGGHGLTLTESRIVKIYNRTFKYSENIQMEDRTHRIGQEEQVIYTDIHCAGTIDDKIWSAYMHKGNLLDDFKKEVDAVKHDGMKERLRDLILKL